MTIVALVVTADQHARLLKLCKWFNDTPNGLLTHITPNGLNVGEHFIEQIFDMKANIIGPDDEIEVLDIDIVGDELFADIVDDDGVECNVPVKVLVPL